MRRWWAVGIMIGVVLFGDGVAPAAPTAVRHAGRDLAMGRARVRMIEDGRLQLPVGLLQGIGAAEAARMCGADTVGTPLNAFLVTAPGLHALIDAGYGHDPDEDTGRLPAGLERAGVAPDSVDLVLITHFHFDHIRGLRTADGRRAFPRAVVRVPQAEHDFWARDTAAMLPRHRQRAIAIRSVFAPYVSAHAYRTFAPGEDLGHGFRARSEAGHTPGHASFEFVSGGKAVWFIGDLIHFGAVQFGRPDVTLEFDSDSAAARASRLDCFGRAARSGAVLAGVHLPAFVRLERRGAGFAAAPLDLP